VHTGSRCAPRCPEANQPVSVRHRIRNRSIDEQGTGTSEIEWVEIDSDRSDPEPGLRVKLTLQFSDFTCSK
jgi:hypothetical protein